MQIKFWLCLLSSVMEANCVVIAKQLSEKFFFLLQRIQEATCCIHFQSQKLFLSPYEYKFEKNWITGEYFITIFPVERNFLCGIHNTSLRRRPSTLLAPQSGALRISAYRDFHPIPNPILPLIAFEHLSLSIVIWNSPSRPRQMNVDQGRPKQVVQVAPCSQPSPFLIPQVLFKRVSLPFLSPCSSRSSLPSPRAHLRSLGCSMVLCFPFLIISSSSSYFFLSHSLLLWSLSPFFFSLFVQNTRRDSPLHTQMGRLQKILLFTIQYLLNVMLDCRCLRF